MIKIRWKVKCNLRLYIWGINVNYKEIGLIKAKPWFHAIDPDTKKMVYLQMSWWKVTRIIFFCIWIMAANMKKSFKRREKEN